MRGKKYFLPILIFSLFFPYVIVGDFSLRADQILVYFLLIFSLTGLKQLPKKLVIVVSILLLSLLVSLIYSLIEGIPGSGNHTLWLGAIDSLLLPLATVIVVFACIDRKNYVESLIIFRNSLAVGLVLSTIIALMQLMHSADWADFFWSGSTTGTSTGALSLANDRYTGIFNQPIEGGIAFGLGLFVSNAYRFKHWATQFAIVTILLTGGLLGGSKVFLCAIAIQLCLLVFRLLTKTDNFMKFAIMICSMITSVALLHPSKVLVGFDRRVNQAINFQPVSEIGQSTNNLPVNSSFISNLLTALTGGRFGSNASINLDLFSFGGKGFYNSSEPLDNAFFDVTFRMGLIGLILLLILIAAIYTICKEFDIRSESRPFGIGVFLLILVSLIGINSLTANRASTLLWILIVIFACTPEICRKEVSSIQVGR